MPLCAGTGPVLGRCWQHPPSTGPVLATNGMFTGFLVFIMNKNVVQGVNIINSILDILRRGDADGRIIRRKLLPSMRNLRFVRQCIDGQSRDYTLTDKLEMTEESSFE